MNLALLYSAINQENIRMFCNELSNSNLNTDLVAKRTFPKLSSLLGHSNPPGPKSMMGQFSARKSAGNQKKHRCRVCEKRFVRPSALQIHIYSHTGEKREFQCLLPPLEQLFNFCTAFKCEVEDCGKYFSVVSNLRRHGRMHQSQGIRQLPRSRSARELKEI
jgi:uncharacterized Zn-finger protein